MVDLSTIITIAISVIIIGVIGFIIYNRKFRGGNFRRGLGQYPRMTREGELLEDYGGGGTRLMSRPSIRVVIPAIIGFVILMWF